MHFRLPLLMALVILTALAPVSVQQSFVTMRTSLRTDLTPQAIAAEALGASKRIVVGEKDESIALRVVAEALASVGRTDEARTQLGLAIKAAKRAPSSIMVGPCLPLYARLHGSAKAMEFLDQISDRERRTRAGISWVKAALERGDESNLKKAAAALHSRYYKGWHPDADAQLSVAYRRLGKLEWSKTTADRVLAGDVSESHRMRVGWAVRALIHEALEAGDFDRAESYLSRFAKLEWNPEDVDFERRLLVQSFIERGQFERAVRQFEKMVDRHNRSQAQASIGLEWLRMGERQKALDHLVPAMQDADRSSMLTRRYLMSLMYWADAAFFNDPIGIWFSDSLDKVKGESAGPVRTNDARNLATGAADMAREDLFDLVLPLIEPKAMTSAGIEFVQTYARREDLGGLLRIMDEWLLREDLAQMEYDLAQAIRTAAWEVKGRGTEPPVKNDRFRAELLEALVDRARRVDGHAARAFTLAVLVKSGLAKPLEPSATHPWHVPPILAGGWSTPEDPIPYAASLQAALGERPMPVVRAIRTRRLAFDPEAELVEIDGVLGALPHHFLLVRRGEQTLLFDGSREPVDALGSSAQWQGDDEALIELIHFSIGARATKDGRFRLVHSLDELAGLTEPGAQVPALKLEPAKVVERGEGTAKIETNMLVAGQLERINASVDRAGRVSLSGLSLIGNGLPFGREFAVGGGFKRRRKVVEDALLLYQDDPAAGAYAVAHAYATGFGTGGWLRDTNIAWSWLLMAQQGGHPHPFRQIGLDWRDGNGVPAKRGEAEEWLVGSAKNGDVEAGLAAFDLLRQSSSPERRARALRVVEIGAKAGHAPSIERLQREK